MASLEEMGGNVGHGMFPCRHELSVCCGRSSLGAILTINVCIFEMVQAYFHCIVGNIVFIEPQLLFLSEVCIKFF